MRLCDREGIVVIDETPAVGLMVSFGFDVSMLESDDYQDDTWTKLKTADAHKQVIKEIIERDKNHACVAMWSIANEAATFPRGPMNTSSRCLMKRVNWILKIGHVLTRVS